MKIEIREVTLDDAQLLFDWANDVETRENSFNSNPIEWDNHVSWLTKKLTDPSCKIFIFHQNNQPLSVVRFESDEDTVIGITVAPNQRGKGFGAELIKKGCLKFWENNNHPILAYIKRDNVASQRVFEKAGFTFYKNDNFANTACLILIAEKDAN